MSFLNRSKVIDFPQNGKTPLEELADLTEEVQAGLGRPSISADFLKTVTSYLNKIDSFLPKPAVRDPAADEFLWKEGDADKCLSVYKTLGAISNHPDLGSCECGPEEIVGVKALRLMVTLMLYVPGLDEKMKEPNESA